MRELVVRRSLIPLFPVRFAYRALCGVVGLLLPSASLAADPAIVDTGYEIIHTIVTPSLYWIDNNRLLFAGIKTADMQKAFDAKEENRVARLRKLYLWDNIAKSVRHYADAQSGCFSDGVVHYQVRVDKTAGKAFFKEGLLGSEKEIEKPLPSKEELSWQEEAQTSAKQLHLQDAST